MKKIKFTKEGLEKIKQEYKDLLEKRKPAVQTLKQARELGDLSENGLYHAAKANLRSIDGRMRRLSYMIKVSDVTEKPKDTVGIGSKVTVFDGKSQTTYQLVGDFEANPLEHKISANSPIGSRLIGKKTGETVVVYTPNKRIELKIIKLE